MDFKLPEIGEGVVEGELVKWLVKEGDQVKADQPILEVLTDKATVEIASPAAGKISKFAAQPGQMVAIGATICVIDTGGKEVSEPSAPKDSSPAPKENKKEEVAQKSAPSTMINSADVRAFPATRKLANELGVDLSQVQGSGPKGRITKEDVEGFKGGSGAKKQAPVAIQTSQEDEIIPLRGIRKVIAENMRVAKDNATHFMYVDEVDMTKLVAMRSALKDYANTQGVKLSYLPFFVKAVVNCLKKFPYFNSSLDMNNKQIIVKKRYNIGVAVDTDEGLVVPVIKNADQKTVLEIANEIVHLAEGARNKKLAQSDYKDGTFTITSIGSIGGLMTAPIINYPEVAILGINKIQKRPIVENGQVVVKDMMYISMSLDHRVIDGANAARFCNELITYLAEPTKIMLEMR